MVWTSTVPRVWKIQGQDHRKEGPGGKDGRELTATGLTSQRVGHFEDVVQEGDPQALLL